jgi:hypothetical protein
VDASRAIARGAGDVTAKLDGFMHPLYGTPPILLGAVDTVGAGHSPRSL